MSPTLQTLVADANAFSPRHLSLTEADRLSMLEACDAEHLEALIEQAVPSQIRRSLSLNLPAALGEDQAVEYIRKLATKNEVYTSMIGQGYSDCVTPPVIARNILKTPVGIRNIPLIKQRSRKVGLRHSSTFRRWLPT